jgi:rhodanese-related sulfurtransferase
MLRRLFSRKPAGASLPDVDPAAAHTAAQAGGLRLVDVREPDEFAAGHPAGAVNVPLSRLPGALDELPAGPLAISCRSGARSRKAGELALAAGRTEVQNVAGGYLAWDAAGLPTESGA